MGHLCAISKHYIHTLSTILLLISCAGAKAQQPGQPGTAQCQSFPNEQSTIRQWADTANNQPLNVGDTIPESLWHLPLQVVNHPEGKDTITLNDYRGKLVILDFWATWCSSCIKHIPKLNALQKEIGQKDLQVLLVNSKSTRDNGQKAGQFLSKRQNAYNLTSIVEDTVLTELFPHRTIPHYIWINKGRFLAVTDGEDLTNENVQNALDGKDLQTSYVADIDYNIRLPLFENGNGGESPGYVYRSILAPYLKGLRRTRSTGQEKGGKISRITFTNTPIMALYRYAYPFLSGIAPTRLLLEVHDPGMFSPDGASSTWMARHCYNYEVQFPPCTYDKAKEIMRADLQRFFGYSVESIEKEVKCLVMKQSGTKKSASVADAEKKHTITNGFDVSETGYAHHAIEALAYELEKICNVPVIDETGLDGSTQFLLPKQQIDIDVLHESLEMQGISLTKADRRISIAIISEK